MAWLAVLAGIWGGANEKNPQAGLLVYAPVSVLGL